MLSITHDATIVRFGRGWWLAGASYGRRGSRSGQFLKGSCPACDWFWWSRIVLERYSTSPTSRYLFGSWKQGLAAACMLKAISRLTQRATFTRCEHSMASSIPNDSFICFAVGLSDYIVLTDIVTFVVCHSWWPMASAAFLYIADSNTNCPLHVSQVYLF